MRPLGAQTLEIHCFELIPKTLKICGFSRIYAKNPGKDISNFLAFYVSLQGFFGCLQPHDARILR